MNNERIKKYDPRENLMIKPDVFIPNNRRGNRMIKFGKV